MPLRVRVTKAEPPAMTTDPAETLVTAVVSSTRSEPTQVQVTFTSGGRCASAVAEPKTVTVPKATDPTDPDAHGKVEVSQTVKLTAVGARPCMESIDVKVWEGPANDPDGPATSDSIRVSLL